MMIGMDFGTTNSGIAHYDGQQLRLIPIDYNAAVARTALYITNNRQIFIGRGAIDTYYEQNLNRPVSIERVRVGEITLTFAELPSFVRDVYIEKDVLSPGRLFISFKTALSSLNYVGTVVGSHFYFLEDIVALYLAIARQRAESKLKTELRRIVLGRPVHFSMSAEGDQLARERLLKAAFRAGYEEVYLQYEPIAAAYHYETLIDREQNVLVFDFGGGTLDISVLRIGNPKTRRVLATGGLPIAGDIFDQKLARAKLPKHFGEGSFYRSGDKQLPMPGNFYEAFSNWQDLLALQKPEFFEHLQKIERTSQKPLQIRAFKHLVSTNYALKMFDVVEGAKRELSSSERALIKLDGSHFQVREPLTRGEFERIIWPDIQAIEAHLDRIIAESGLAPDQIDTVIRTGGSSQIPAFVAILEKRFGKEKVRSVDIFSSVTSGLGIIAHRIEQGELEATPYHSKDYPLTERQGDMIRNGVPAIDFDMMRKFIALSESASQSQTMIGLVALTKDRKVLASVHTTEDLQREKSLKDLAGAESSIEQIISAGSDTPLVVCTSEYRFFIKTPEQLARLNELGLDLAESEGFHRDEFGHEYVSALSRWTAVDNPGAVILITHSGHYKVFTETLIPRVEQPVPYRVNRLKGDPIALIKLGRGHELAVFGASGRVVRMKPELMGVTEGRIAGLTSRDRVIAACAAREDEIFLLATPDGKIAYLNFADIPEPPTAKSFIMRSVTSVAVWGKNQPVWVLTSHRVLLLQPDMLPFNSHKTAQIHKIHLKRDETLVGLLTF